MGLYRRGRVWWYEFVFEGARVRESARTRTRELAERIERKRRDELAAGRAGVLRAPQPTVREAVAALLAAMVGEVRPFTVRRAQISAGFLLPALGDVRAARLTADDVRSYRAARVRTGAAAATANKEVALLRQALRRTGDWQRIAPGLRSLPETEVGRALSYEEEERLLAASRASRSRWLYPAVIVSLDAALRRGELSALRWSDVDLPARMLTARQTKLRGAPPKAIPLSERAARALAEIDDGGAPERRVLGGSWRAAWEAARRAAGVRCRWHDLRHTAASRLLASHASEHTVAAITGHMSRAMLDRYGHTRIEERREAVAAVERARGRVQ